MTDRRHRHILRFDTMTELAIDLLAGKLINDASEVRRVILSPSLEIRRQRGRRHASPREQNPYPVVNAKRFALVQNNAPSCCRFPLGDADYSLKYTE